MPQEGIDALLVSDAAKTSSITALFGEFVEKTRLPAIYPRRDYVEVGGLMAYATNLKVASRRAAGHVDKILKGAKPGELPIFQPTAFELIINVKAARTLGLMLPPTLLARADEVIE